MWDSLPLLNSWDCPFPKHVRLSPFTKLVRLSLFQACETLPLLNTCDSPFVKLLRLSLSQACETLPRLNSCSCQFPKVSSSRNRETVPFPNMWDYYFSSTQIPFTFPQSWKCLLSSSTPRAPCFPYIFPHHAYYPGPAYIGKHCSCAMCSIKKWRKAHFGTFGQDLCLTPPPPLSALHSSSWSKLCRARKTKNCDSTSGS